MDTKTTRKLNRAVHLLKRHVPDVKVSTAVSSKILYVANSGIICGVNHDELHSVFSSYGNVCSIHVVLHKPYCFVEFSDVSEAEMAFRDLQGTHPSGIQKEDVVLYLAFVEEIPKFTSDAKKLPDGALILTDFVSENEEKELWSLVETRLKEHSAGSLKHRQVMHFGYQFSYDSNSAMIDGPFPEKIPEVCERIVDSICEAHLVENRPDQLTVNVYQPGQGIPFHTDTHSAFQEIVMNFSDPESEDGVPVLLPSRSLLVMRDGARYRCKHGIAPRKYDTLPDGKLLKRSLRCSFTFRAVRTLPCQCAFPKFCDWKRPEGSESVDSVIHRSHKELEWEHVVEVYDAIAPHFDSTRHSQWPGVKSFLDSLDTGSVVLDVGCGNGKYLRSDGRLIKIGCDLSESLCEICRKKNCETVVSNCMALPFQNGRFDASLSVAVIHHLSSKERRIKAISEQVRVLKCGGRALIFVWALEQVKNAKKSAYLKSDEPDGGMVAEGQRSFRTESGTMDLVVHKNRQNFGAQDLLVPWELNKGCVAQGGEKNERFLRFYHVFRENELEKLCEEVTECQVLSSFYEQGNWCVVLNKL